MSQMDTTPWICTSCQKKNSYRAEFCDQCGTSWSWSLQPGYSSWNGGQWQDQPKTPRRRSSSKNRGKGKGYGGKAQGKGKSKGNNGDGDFSGLSSSSPWQQSSALETLGVPAPEMSQRAQPQASTRQVDGLITGLRAHMKSLGQETCPEIEAYLAKCLGNGPQIIKQASQRLEASGKAAAKIKVELAQLRGNWQKFQKKVEEEYMQQKNKFIERQKQLQEGLQKAEEEYTQAQEALREAAKTGQPEESALAGITKPPLNPTEAEAAQDQRMEGTPKRTHEAIIVEDDDHVMKKLKSPIKVEESPGKKNLGALDF